MRLYSVDEGIRNVCLFGKRVAGFDDWLFDVKFYLLLIQIRGFVVFDLVHCRCWKYD